MIESVERRKVYQFVQLNEQVLRTNEIRDILGIENFSIDFKEKSSYFVLILSNGDTFVVPFNYYVAKDDRDNLIVLSPKEYRERFEPLLTLKTN